MSTNGGGENIIVAEGLTKRYDNVAAVDDISFNVGRGEIFGMLGPNGAGKTTTVEILEGLRVADEGNAVVAGVDVKKDPKKVKSLIGVQLQTAAFFDHLTLSETIALYGKLYGIDVNPDEILEKVELVEKRKSTYAKLSGGQKQRLSVAIGLVNKPVVLFLDEPTTALDPQARRHMWELVDKIREDGTTIMLTTHYMEEAEELCDRVAIVDKGKIVAMDTPDTLIDQLVDSGFRGSHRVREASLEDVFIHLTGRSLRDE